MLYLHKILPALVLPLGLCILLLGAALFWRKRILVLIPLMILLLASNPVVSSFLLFRLENRFPKIEIADCAEADAVVVLSGVLGSKRSARESLELNWGEAYDRFDAAVRLFQAGKASWLVLADPRMPWERPNSFSEGKQILLVAMERGIPADKIILLGPVGNTADEASLVVREGQKRGWRKIILVTTAWHMPRAFLLFQHKDFVTIPFPTDFQTSGKLNLASLLSFLPTAKSLMFSETYLRERIGFAFYKFRRFLP